MTQLVSLIICSLLALSLSLPRDETNMRNSETDDRDDSKRETSLIVASASFKIVNYQKSGGVEKYTRNKNKNLLAHEKNTRHNTGYHTNHFLYHEKLRPAAQFLPSELASADFFVHQK